MAYALSLLFQKVATPY